MAKNPKTASKTVTEYVLSEDGQGCFSDASLAAVRQERAERISLNKRQGVAPKEYTIVERTVEYDARGNAVADPSESEVEG